MDKARAVLASLPRCTAKSRQSGMQCKNPGLGAGGKCRFHGGASISEKATVADYKALRKAYDLVNDLQLEVEHLKLKLHESDSRSIYMGRLLANTKEQLRQQSFVNFKNYAMYEI